MDHSGASGKQANSKETRQGDEAAMPLKSVQISSGDRPRRKIRAQERSGARTSSRQRDYAAMKTIDRRVANLEHRFGIARTRTTYLVVLMDAGTQLRPAQEAYIKSLHGTGFFHDCTFGVVDLTKILSGTQCPMNDALIVRGLQRRGDLPGESERGL